MTTPKSKEEMLAEMDADAKKAREEFNDMCGHLNEVEASTLANIKGWWERWYPKAGHKRLAYILTGKKLNGD